MNVKEIREMINLMNENGLVELEIEKEGMRIRLKKGSGYPDVSSGGQIVIEKERLIPEAPRVPQALEAAEKAAAKTVEIKAPMVGTFYRAPSPESPAYVEVGQVIEPGQVICIIEAMKLMNEIKAEARAKVVEIIVENAEPVEFGQPMFIVEPL
ncbi:MAG TPA: acetyl-CoA carboxylase biotin carboxyl carrier protein [Patescibacteria group bacterium]|nr:acetyl-CoA carboxylase biotin carboxyl carrier protein [Patescibacteria group bacterium]